MKCFIGLGSNIPPNLGKHREIFEKAGAELREISHRHHLRVSPIYQTPALLPPEAPLEWDVPYLNAVAEIEWKEGSSAESAGDLLQRLKRIETNQGRKGSSRWAPRVLDLDLLTFGSKSFQKQDLPYPLKVPHAEMWNRSFVLDPLKDLAPHFRISAKSKSAVVQARLLKKHAPLLMAVVNLTPDSFSGPGSIEDLLKLDEKVQLIDLGAESTRPGATPVSPEEEWKRLQPSLKFLKEKYHGKIFRPLVSVDTRHVFTAERALENGADWINDVSGLTDPKMVQLLKKTTCDFVVMHSLSVPADPKVTLKNSIDVVEELKCWLEGRMKLLEENGIDSNRMIFDPGIGFGKTPHQSIELLKRAEEFADLPVRILFGHSRKSFMKIWGFDHIPERDAVTIGISLALTTKGADILRVHDYAAHEAGLRAFREICS